MNIDEQDRKRMRPLTVTVYEVVRHAGLNGYTAEDTADCFMCALLALMFQVTRSEDEVAALLEVMAQRVREDATVRDGMKNASVMPSDLH